MAKKLSLSLIFMFVIQLVTIFNANAISNEVPIYNLPILFQSSGWSKEQLSDKLGNSYGSGFEVSSLNKVQKITFALESKYTNFKGKIIIPNRSSSFTSGELKVSFETDGVLIKDYVVNTESFGIDFNIDVSGIDKITIITNNISVNLNYYVCCGFAHAVVYMSNNSETTNTTSLERNQDTVSMSTTQASTRIITSNTTPGEDISTNQHSGSDTTESSVQDRGIYNCNMNNPIVALIIAIIAGIVSPLVYWAIKACHKKYKTNKI